MFGISAYAQSPYASLGGALWITYINEGAVAADTVGAQVALLSIISELATGNDLVYPNVAFVGQIAETVTGTDRDLGLRSRKAGFDEDQPQPGLLRGLRSGIDEVEQSGHPATPPDPGMVLQDRQNVVGFEIGCPD